MSELKLVVNHEEKAALIIDLQDNVAIALADLQAGETCLVRKGDQVEKLTVLEDVPFGHKIAFHAIGQDESVLKYGEEIGKMAEPVQKGGWIHSHNMYCVRAMANGR